MPTVIGVSGKIYTGKSTVSRFLKDWGVVRSWRDFGDEIKKETAETFQFPLEYCYTEEGKETVIFHPRLPGGALTVRRILQWWGTDVRRAEDPHYWVEKMRSWIMANRPDSLVIGDVRFWEEVEFVRHAGGWLFRILPFPGWSPGATALHRSETDLDQWTGWDRVYSPDFGAAALRRVARDIEAINTAPHVGTRDVETN